MTATDPSRAQLLEDRRHGIGGSDIASLWSLGYGCELRLFREKSGQPADFPDRDSGPMKLGRWLEPHIADEYQAATGRRVYPEGVLRHPHHPELLVHVDRTIIDPKRTTPGVLEIKALGARAFGDVKREGMIIDYRLQLQHAMLVTSRTWGAFAVMNRDTAEMLHWDMERDEATCAMILEDGPAFWRTIPHGPPPPMLEPDDKRCQSCRWRVSCQGAALMASDKQDIEQDESLRPLLAEYDARRGLAEEASNLVEEVREMIRVAMGKREAVRVGKRPVYYRPQTSMRLDGESIEAAYARAAGHVDYDGTFVPAGAATVAREFRRPSVSRPLRIF
jgi:predicted phage-related endonuclease